MSVQELLDQSAALIIPKQVDRVKVLKLVFVIWENLEVMDDQPEV